MSEAITRADLYAALAILLLGIFISSPAATNFSEHVGHRVAWIAFTVFALIFAAAAFGLSIGLRSLGI